MKVKETTPPAQRTFTIELDENALRVLAILVGQSAPSEFNFSHDNANSRLQSSDIKNYYAKNAGEIYTKLASVFSGEEK